MDDIKNENNTLVEAKNHKPSKRYAEFDVLRTVSMMLMVVAHTWEQFHDYILDAVLEQNAWFSCSYAFIGPSVLMICLGTNLAFSRRATPDRIIRRGVLFLGIDVLLNVIRFGVPSIVLHLIGRPGYIESYFLPNLLSSDIYAFVGVFFILYGLFKKWNLNSLAILGVSMITLSINTLVNQFHLNTVDNWILQTFIGRFFWTGYGSYFSLFPWLVFPAIGCCFGDFWIALAEDKKRKFVNRLLISSVISLLAFSIALISHGISPTIAVIPWNDYKTDLLSVILMTLLAGFVFGIAHMLVERYSDSLFVRLSMKISRVIMPFYVVQWIMIGWIQFTFEGMRAYDVIRSGLVVYLSALAIIAASLFMSFQYEKLKTRKHKPS